MVSKQTEQKFEESYTFYTMKSWRSAFNFRSSFYWSREHYF